MTNYLKDNYTTNQQLYNHNYLVFLNIHIVLTLCEHFMNMIHITYIIDFLKTKRIILSKLAFKITVSKHENFYLCTLQYFYL